MNQFYHEDIKYQGRSMMEWNVTNMIETPKDYYRQYYYEVFDIVSNEISRRFDQRDFIIVGECEKLLLNSANNIDFTIPESVHATYKQNIKADRLSVHLKMLPDIIKRHGKLQEYQLRKLQMYVLSVIV